MVDMGDNGPTDRVRTGGLLAAMVAGLAAIALVLAGCGGSGDDPASKSAAEILAASRTAALSASSVRVLTTATGGKRTTLALDMQLARDGARRHTTISRRTQETIDIGGTVYVKSDSSLDARLAKTKGVHLPAGVWLKEPSRARTGEQTDLSRELGFLLRHPTIPLTKGATTTIKGQKAIELKEQSNLYTVAIYIATTGQPYPIKIVRHGRRETSQTTFTAWNQPVTLSAPASAVELSKLEHKAH